MSWTNKISLIIILFFIVVSSAFAQKDQAENLNRKRFFLAYEFGEAAFNSFQSLSGEIGIRFPNNHMFRIVHMNVNLTEGHLSSSFAGAVDGDNVKGVFLGFEAFYDFPILVEGLYLGPSIGYYNNEYQHTLFDEVEMNESATLGVGISFREKDIFGVNGLYYMVSIPIRIALDPSDETMLGSSIIKSNQFDNNIWLFVGFEF